MGGGNGEACICGFANAEPMSSASDTAAKAIARQSF